ncbi:transposase domain-containing protein [Martelella mediterranea]|uniref:Mu DNA-binding protein n=1 Tax=Martelella mediterranea TaxID=293089 RepID=A0A4R3P0X4_9HYPH|nr:transposase domain-containing protein [Martelella mediterranea]TCT39599.1 Mu DNA-binding protein [Martelella mediterranea]
MKEWFTSSELAEARLPDLPASRTGVENFGERQGWRESRFARKRKGRGGGYEYHISLLPDAAQARLRVAHLEAENEKDRSAAAARKALWKRYEALSKPHKQTCEKRLNALLKVNEMVGAGVSARTAFEVVAKMEGVSERILYYWQSLADKAPRADWLAALAPSFASQKTHAECHEKAWQVLLSDYLRPEAPAFSACYRRMTKVAEREGWLPVPGERSLRRRLEAEVPRSEQVIAREGKEKAKALYPAQRRSKTNLHAMQMVNMDGHKIDVFVRVPWSEKPVRMYLLGIQDVFSGKIVAWRLSEAETWTAVRLVIGDMVEQYGIPDDMVLDNGRAFASKWISGQTPTRFRNKIRPEDPRGLVTTLGINLLWSLPYSGQSKPIERAWRDLAEAIGKHPFCSGAYTGPNPDAKPENYAQRAIPLEDFRTHVAAQIADHNAQPGRRAETCRGRSFDETFEASLAQPTSIVRWPTAAQRSVWLLASEALKAAKGNGLIHFQKNRYWSPELSQYAGKKVTVRFDPDNLHQPLKVYDLNDRLICEANCLDDTGFKDMGAAKEHGKARSSYLKAEKAALAAKRKLTASELGEIIYRGKDPQKPAKPMPQRPVVTRLATAHQLKPVQQEDDDFEESFSRALSLIKGDDGVIKFPKGKASGE